MSDDQAPAERLDAAYGLFAANGVNQVGIETILKSGMCQKVSLYSNCRNQGRSRDCLPRQWKRYGHALGQSEIKRRASDPKERLLAIFDVFDGWFHKKTFEGCSFINVLLELKTG